MAAGADRKNTKSGKQGKFSGTQHSGFVCQEVLAPKSFATTLEVRTTLGDVVFSRPLPELSPGHQVTADGQRVYVHTGGKTSNAGILRRLIAVTMADGTSRDVAISTSALPAADDEFVAYFTEGTVVVEGHDGRRVFEQPVGTLGVVHGSPAHACALLPGRRLAISRGHRGAEKIADLTVFNLDSGREELNIELPVTTFHTTFVPAALRADPQGRFVAIPGFHAGLLIVDLETGKDVADRFPPDPLDLADARPTQHANHTYSDFAFDREGLRIAAAYSPGKVSVWSRDGGVIRREWIVTNPKAQRIVTFDSEGVAFFDSLGAHARFAIDP